MTGSTPVRGSKQSLCSIAEMHRSSKATDVGSNPIGGSKHGEMAERFMHFPHKEEQVGSIPTLTTTVLVACTTEYNYSSLPKCRCSSVVRAPKTSSAIFVVLQPPVDGYLLSRGWSVGSNPIHRRQEHRLLSVRLALILEQSGTKPFKASSFRLLESADTHPRGWSGDGLGHCHLLRMNRVGSIPTGDTKQRGQ